NQLAGLGNPRGAPENGVYRTADGGATWMRIAGPWDTVAGRIGRIAIAVAPSDPNTAYVSIQDTADFGLLGLFRSDKAGAATPVWTRVADVPGIGGFCTDPEWGKACSWAMVILVDPLDPSTLYTAGRRYAFRCASCGASPTWTVLVPSA